MRTICLTAVSLDVNNVFELDWFMNTGAALPPLYSVFDFFDSNDAERKKLMASSN